jgi:hypothetical protein
MSIHRVADAEAGARRPIEDSLGIDVERRV